MRRFGSGDVFYRFHRFHRRREFRCFYRKLLLCNLRGGSFIESYSALYIVTDCLAWFSVFRLCRREIGR